MHFLLSKWAEFHGHIITLFAELVMPIKNRAEFFQWFRCCKRVAAVVVLEQVPMQTLERDCI